MSYNMYDKNYGSGFTPENDNRPPEERPYSASSQSDSSPTTPVNGEYHYSYGFQAAEGEPVSNSGGYTPPPTPPVTPPQSSRPPHRSNPQPKASPWAKVLAMLLACLLVGGAAGVGGAYFVFNSLNGNSSSSSDTATDTTDSDAGSEEESDTVTSADVQVSDRTTDSDSTSTSTDGTMTASEIYEAYSNSVVSIEVQTSSGVGAGTGFVITSDGYILTCYHVIDGYQAISCTFIDSTSYEATYVGGDEDADLAVLKIESTDGSSFTPVVIGDSDSLEVGSTVTAVGNALGTFANTVTTGIVSGLDRALTMSDGTVMNVLQTDCTVNSGNSGGPLFNEYGEVIGVVNAKYSSSGYSTSTATIEGIGFAIPINDAMDILDDLIEYGYITGKPYLGISVSTVSSITAQQYSNMVVGAYVTSVEEGSCSETAGLQVGDIITQVDGTDITTYEELVDAKNTHKAGEDMTLTVYRDGTYYTIVVTLDEEVPDSAADDSTTTEDSTTDGSGDSSQSTNPYEYFFGQGGW